MKTLVVTLLTLGCAAILPAPAQDIPKKPEPPKPPQRQPFDRNGFMKKYDKNGDGKLDDKERQEARKERQAEFLKQYDKNKDGKLDDAERKAARDEFQKSRQNANQNQNPDADKTPNKKPVEEKKEPK